MSLNWKHNFLTKNTGGQFSKKLPKSIDFLEGRSGARGEDHFPSKNLLQLRYEQSDFDVTLSYSIKFL